MSELLRRKTTLATSLRSFRRQILLSLIFEAPFFESARIVGEESHYYQSEHCKIAVVVSVRMIINRVALDYSN